MDYLVHITVHIYAEEQLDDRALTLHSKNYGIVGKEIIAPLRRINGKEYCIKNVQTTFKVADLWKWLDLELCGYSKKNVGTQVYDLIQENIVLKKYLIFNDLRYTVEDINKPLLHYLNIMHVSDVETVHIQILVNANAGDVFPVDDSGIRYFMRSKESGSHHEAHVHVETRDGATASFSLKDGRQLTKSNKQKIKSKDFKKIQETIRTRKKELLIYWNEHTDGLTVDLNQALGCIQY